MTERILLLIEDNPDDESLTLRALRKHHFANRAIVVRDGVEALDWLFVRGQHADRDVTLRPQVVLLDLNLPKLNGIDVLRAIRENPTTRQVPVVILTSSKEDRDLVETYQLGANGYVCKPVSFNEFSDAVRKLGLYWLLLNELPSK
jgi:DNA-binding response OmpR family regulator